MTTILANFVGRSEVSAITQTPASGPFALVTTPPRSFSPMRIASSLLCWAFNRNTAPINMATPRARINEWIVLAFFMKSLLMWICRAHISAGTEHAISNLSRPKTIPCIALVSDARFVQVSEPRLYVSICGLDFMRVGSRHGPRGLRRRCGHVPRTHSTAWKSHTSLGAARLPVPYFCAANI